MEDCHLNATAHGGSTHRFSTETLPARTVADLTGNDLEDGTYSKEEMDRS